MGIRTRGQPQQPPLGSTHGNHCAVTDSHGNRGGPQRGGHAGPGPSPTRPLHFSPRRCAAEHPQCAIGPAPQPTAHGPQGEEMGCRVTGAPLGAPHGGVPALPPPGIRGLRGSSTYCAPGGAPGAGRPHKALPQEAPSRESWAGASRRWGGRRDQAEERGRARVSSVDGGPQGGHTGAETERDGASWTDVQEQEGLPEPPWAPPDAWALQGSCVSGVREALGPGRAAQLVRASSCAPKGRGFSSQSGHTRRVRV